jgi:galactose-1-phosphate uridylyltransferase
LNLIFKKEVSYSLSLHQGPVNEEGTTAYHLYFKLHTPQRNTKSKKLLGAVETSSATYINGTLPETATAKLRNLIM